VQNIFSSVLTNLEDANIANYTYSANLLFSVTFKKKKVALRKDNLGISSNENLK
jgi:hypothetical protein